MTEQQFAKLERIKHYHTRYELIATDGQRSILLAYSPRNNRTGLISVLRERWDALAKLTGTNAFILGKRASDPVTVQETTWTFKWSGRTQREAILAGEHPFILTVIR